MLKATVKCYSAGVKTTAGIFIYTIQKRKVLPFGRIKLYL